MVQGASGKADAVEALPLALTRSQRHVAGLDPLNMAIFEEKIATVWNPALAGVIGRFGRTPIFWQDPLNTWVQ